MEATSVNSDQTATRGASLIWVHIVKKLLDNILCDWGIKG